MKFCANLGVITHKIIYKKDGEYYTTGGFPRQMTALRMMFRSLTVCAPVKRVAKLPPGLQNISDIGIQVEELPYVTGVGLYNKFLFILKLHIILQKMYIFLKKVDIVEVRIPNYVGLIGAIVTKYKHKPAFIWLGGNWWERIKSYDSGLFRRMMAILIKGLLWKILRGFLIFTLDPLMFRKNGIHAQLVPVVSTTIWKEEIVSKSVKYSEPLSLLFVGRLSKEKGIGMLIESLPFIDGKIQWKLTIVGDGPMKEQLIQRIKELNLHGNVQFVGRVPREKVGVFYKNAHVLIVPSTSETFPKVIIEGMANGLVIIASNVGAIGYFLNERNSILIDNINPKSIADAITKLKESKEKFENLSKESLNFAKNHTLQDLNLIMRDYLIKRFKLKICQ